MEGKARQNNCVTIFASKFVNDITMAVALQNFKHTALGTKYTMP